jgi:hypothetical protein
LLRCDHHGTIGDRFGRQKLLTLACVSLLGSLGLPFRIALDADWLSCLMAWQGYDLPSTISIIINVFTDIMIGQALPSGQASFHRGGIGPIMVVS